MRAPVTARRLGALCIIAALALAEVPLPARASAPVGEARGPVAPDRERIPVPEDMSPSDLPRAPAGRRPDGDRPARPADPEDMSPSRIPRDPDVGGPVAPVGPVTDPVALLAPPPLSAVPHAQRLAAAGRFIEAAQAWEQMFKETGDARLLYHAALARMRAGQHARAWQLLTQVLAALGPTSDIVRRHLEEKIAEQKTLTVAVRLRVHESTSGGLVQLPQHLVAGARVVIEPAPGGQPVSQDSLELTGYQGTELRVDAGAWQVRVDLANFAPYVGLFRALPSAGEHAWDIVVERQLVAVDLRFSPPKALRGAKLSLVADDHTPGFAIDRALLGPTQTVMLTAGTWRLRATSRRYRADRTLTITPAMGPVDVVMTKGQADVASDDRLSIERKELFGLLGYVTIGWYAGIGLMVGGANVQSKAEQRNRTLLEEAGADPKTPPFDAAVLTQVDAAFPTAEYHRRLELGSSLSFSGAAVAMSGLGMALGLLPVMLHKPRRKLLIPFGVGLAVAAGGAAWTAHWARAREDLLEPATAAHRVDERPFDRLVGHQLGGSMLLGIGAGMVTVASAYWLGQAVKRRKKARALADAAPLTAPGTLGLTVRGRF